MPSLDHRIPPPIVGAVTGLAMWLVAPLGPAWPMPPSLGLGLTVLLVAIGLGFDLMGLLAFRASRTTVNPLSPHKASALVTGGVYRVTRNPMYVGMLCLLLAWAAHLASWLPLAGPALFVLYITRFQIRPEERVLRQLFGDAYTQYASRVRRWI
ncbi:MAG: isoprenylcysteine carboxylmethyltransferase family protein [Burkholderiaceae bacterium]|nr:MAG: isoprenylcysteine carboxylmethyltransferase family protein [Burkholderiaceae bacterium]